jgi:AP endonuclease 1
MGGKRGANALETEISPARRSKRSRSGIEQKLDYQKEIHDGRGLSSKTVLRSTGKLQNGTCSTDAKLKGSGISKEAEEEQHLKPERKPQKLACQGVRDVDNPLVQKEEEDEEVVSGKTSRRSKAKEETSDQAMPLAARTPGLRMFVGAHVSAAKGCGPLFY